MSAPTASVPRHSAQSNYSYIPPAAPQSMSRGRRIANTILGVIAEILITFAVIVGGYILWQLWWTGVQSEASQIEQLDSMQWINPKTQGNGQFTIAQPQSGDIPVQPQNAKYGDLIAQLYVPRFGKTWQRNIVQGTDVYQLNRHGVGHYENTQMPGQMGNFAVAGHRAGYGEPLAHVDELQEDDSIIVRTQDYWYVYEYTNYEIVLPTQVQVVAAVPNHPDAEPDNRYITLTTCEPRYTTATHRWISYGTLKYWAKVSDGVPKELADSAQSGAVKFSQSAQTPITQASRSLDRIVVALLIAFVVVFLSALIAYRFPALRAIKEGRKPKPLFSLYGSWYRHMPGPAVVRILLMVLVLLAGFAALLQWGYPWAASTIPYLQVASNFVAVG